MLGDFKRLSHTEYIVCIEGYGFARTANIEPLFCIGTLLRYKLYKKGILYVDVPPNNLKKFVTGKGQAKKNLIMKELYKRWGIDTDDDNQADAHGLALFGLAMQNKLKVPKINMDAVIAVRGK